MSTVVESVGEPDADSYELEASRGKVITDHIDASKRLATPWNEVHLEEGGSDRTSDVKIDPDT